jgi:hypothetical protein
LRRLFSLIFLLVSSAALATVMEPLSLEQMTGEADVIVRGTCTGKRVYESQGMIFTEYAISVQDVFKGVPAREVRVRQPGGELNGKGIYIPGAARFAPSEEALVFLGKNIGGSRDVVGWSQGKFHVYYDEQSKTRFAVQDLQGLSVVKKSTGEIIGPEASRFELGKLTSQLREMVAKEKELKK